MKSIVIFGAGNVAIHLFLALSKAQNFTVVQVYNHTSKSLKFFRNRVSTTTNLKEVKAADIFLLALKDEAIPAIAERILQRDALVLHTSGATPMGVLNNFTNYGVFYPLQTFSKEKPVEYKDVPVCIEANSRAALELTEELAAEFSEKTYRISSEQRKSLHVAAVFVSNFVNHLYAEGEELCHENNIPFEILHPLIFETATKIKALDPKDAQTGPAKRRDDKVIDAHLELLQGNRKKIYELLSSSIQQLHGKKL